MSRGGPAGWVALRAVVPDLAEDFLVARLAVDSLGVEVSHAGPGRVRLSVYLEATADRSAWLRAGSAAVSEAGLDPEACDLAIESITDGRWEEAWRASLRPFPLGSRFLVVPGEPPVDRGGRTLLRLSPGRAFGTGEHPTTRMCAEALERRVVPGSSWLDLGTGTGILAMVAAHAGAARVAAVDHDPEAIGVCRETLASNGLDGTIRPHSGGLEAVAPATFDGIVANIASSFFLRHAADLAAALAPEGILIASGFLAEDVPEIEACFSAAGLRRVEVGEDGPWVLVVAAKAGR